jgi:hypothetical protein
VTCALLPSTAPRNYPVQLKDETSRVESEEKEERSKAKDKKKTEKEWEATRETRVGGWRDFMTKKGGSECRDFCLLSDLSLVTLRSGDCVSIHHCVVPCRHLRVRMVCVCPVFSALFQQGGW